MTTNSALTVLDQQLFEFINSDFEIEVLDNNCNFSEGPVWVERGFYLFSDIPANTVYKISAGSAKEKYLEPSGFTGEDVSKLSDQIGSNGLAYDNKGNLLLCQHGNGAIGLFDEVALQPFISTYKSKRFNSPNDIVVHKDGSIFFSDPPYGLKDQSLLPGFSQSIAGIYCFRDGRVELICDRFRFPNGVCLSPDQQLLYCCSTKPFEKHVLVYDRESLQFLQVIAEENSDGIKCDGFGNLYLCTNEGVVILNRDGKRLGIIHLPTQPANAAWGGDKKNDLLITARQNIFLIRNLQK